MDDIEDASLGAAVEKIMSHGHAKAALGDPVAREDKRESRADREPHERDLIGELDAEDLNEGAEPKEAESDDSEEPSGAGAAEGDDGQFLEIPGEDEGAEPKRVPLSEAAEAWKKLSQMNGDIATAVIKAETEAQARQDEITTAKLKAFETVRDQAVIALKAMQRYMPQMPSEVMLDRNGQYYDPEGYWVLRNQYDEHVKFVDQLRGTVLQADEGIKGTQGELAQAMTERENARLARYVPAWADEKGREAHKASIVEALGAKYGLTKADIDEIGDHRALRLLTDLAALTKMAKAAPEVRKQIQEKAPKIVNGRAPQSRDPSSGRYINEARKALKESGSEEAAANVFLRSGRLRHLL